MTNEIPNHKLISNFKMYIILFDLFLVSILFVRHKVSCKVANNQKKMNCTVSAKLVNCNII